VAYDYFQQTEEDDKNKPGQQQQLSGENGIITGNNGGTPVTQGEGEDKKTSSGAFTPLNKYLEANKSRAFGQEVAGKVGEGLDQADQAQSQADTSFRTESDSATTKKNDDLISKAKSSPQDVATEDFAKQRDAYYRGPENFSANDKYNSVRQTSQKAYDTADATRDEAGRKAYLAQTYARPDYSSGQQKLDNLLIQADPSAKPAFEQNWNRSTQGRDRFSSLSSALDSYAQQNKAATDQTRSAARGAIGIDDSGNFRDDSDLMSILGAADKSAADYNTKGQQTYEGLLDDKLTPEEIAMLGGSATSRSYRVDPTQYAQQGATASRGTVLSKDQQARIAALSRLAGKENTYAPDAEAAGSYDPSKAAGYDQGKYNAAVEQSKAAYQQQLAAVQAQLDEFAKQYQQGSTGMSIAAMNQRNAAVADAIARKRQLLEDYSGTLGGQKQYDYAPTPVIRSYENIDPNYQQVPYTDVDPLHRM
jgi:hypothetical protein